jgi:hypothetical protein
MTDSQSQHFQSNLLHTAVFGITINAATLVFIPLLFGSTNNAAAQVRSQSFSFFIHHLSLVIQDWARITMSSNTLYLFTFFSNIKRESSIPKTVRLQISLNFDTLVLKTAMT